MQNQHGDLMNIEPMDVLTTDRSFEASDSATLHLGYLLSGYRILSCCLDDGLIVSIFL
jgi:hypothetical protein